METTTYICGMRGGKQSFPLIQRPPSGDPHALPPPDSNNYLKIEISADGRKLNCCGPSLMPRESLPDKAPHTFPRPVSVATSSPEKRRVTSIWDRALEEPAIRLKGRGLAYGVSDSAATYVCDTSL